MATITKILIALNFLTWGHVLWSADWHEHRPREITKADVECIGNGTILIKPGYYTDFPQLDWCPDTDTLISGSLQTLKKF